MPSDEPVLYPIDGVLDLHTFLPGEVTSLIPDYIETCMEAGIYHLRIIHGKGTGTLRRTVHALLDRDERVTHYQLAGDGAGGWGATLVTLRRQPEPPSEE